MNPYLTGMPSIEAAGLPFKALIHVGNVVNGARLSEFCTSHAENYKNTGKLQLPASPPGYTPVSDRLFIPSANRIVQKSDCCINE